MARELSKAQIALLQEAPDDWERFQRRRGIRFMVCSPTILVLRSRGLIETATMPPRWKLTPAGKAALTRSAKQEV